MNLTVSLITVDAVTTFEFDPKESTFVSFNVMIWTIDEHHPEWTTLNVYGAKLTEPIKNELIKDFNATSVEATELGFTAKR
jgi:hypothetical protein